MKFSRFTALAAAASLAVAPALAAPNPAASLSVRASAEMKDANALEGMGVMQYGLILLVIAAVGYLGYQVIGGGGDDPVSP